MIKVIELQAGFGVEFAFELKDAFKKAFPSAKWDAERRRWVVGPRSKTRLAQWIEAVEPTQQAIEDAHEAALTEEELAQVRAEATALRDRIEQARGGVKALNELAAALSSERAKLADVGAEKAAADLEIEAARDRVLSVLSGIVDLPGVLAQARIMAANHRPNDRTRKQFFEAAREKVKAERDRLRAAGWYSEGLSAIAGANVNRPDRDMPGAVDMDDLLKIHKIEIENEDE